MDAKVAAMLEERREPAIWLGYAEEPVSRSRLGGLPDLPEEVDWPLHLVTNQPLHFLAQIDLSALPATPLPDCPYKASLPRDGMLYIFADIDEEMTFDEEIIRADGMPSPTRVIYAKAAGAEREAPADLPMLQHQPREIDGEFARETNLFQVVHLQAHVINTFRSVSFFNAKGGLTSPFKNDEDGEARNQSIMIAAGLGGDDEDAAQQVLHSSAQMFGWGKSMSYGSTDIKVGDDADILLFEYFLNAPYDEIGLFQFWIKSEELKAQRFERVWATAHFS